MTNWRFSLSWFICVISCNMSFPLKNHKSFVDWWLSNSFNAPRDIYYFKKSSFWKIIPKKISRWLKSCVTCPKMHRNASMIETFVPYEELASIYGTYISNIFSYQSSPFLYVFEPMIASIGINTQVCGLGFGKYRNTARCGIENRYRNTAVFEVRHLQHFGESYKIAHMVYASF